MPDTRTSALPKLLRWQESSVRLIVIFTALVRAPAVVLLDIKMPRRDGIEVLREIRESEELKHVPVVILSSSREETDLARSWDLGVNAYVVKPVNASQFFEAVQTLGQFWAVMNEGRRGN